MSAALKLLKLPSAILAGIISAAAAGGGAWAVASERLEDTRARVEQLEHSHEKIRKDAEDQRLRTQRVEDALTNINDMVREIRSDVKELRRR